MRYVLPDGRSLELNDVVRVSKVRDMGEDASSIEYSKLSFCIYLKGNELIEVSEKYHFSDWSDKKKTLSLIREDLMKNLKDIHSDVQED
jgi:hypothetical protein